MDRHVIPNMPIKPFKRISPSKYFALNSCLLREVWGANYEIPKLLPSSPTIRIGIIAHRMLELTIRGKVHNESDIKNAWDEEVLAIEEEMKASWIESHLIPLSRHAKQYEVKREKCFFMAKSLLRNTYQGQKYADVQAEVWVDTPDGKVGGRIDAIREVNGNIQIVDYKTGNIFDVDCPGEVIKQEYQQQLKLYAAMFFIKRGKWPSKLTVVALNQMEYDVQFNEDECMNLLDNAIKNLEQLNTEIVGIKNYEDIAKPAADTCKFCPYRPACMAYWKERNDSDEWPADCCGEVAEKKLQGNGLLTVVIKNQQENYIVRGLSPSRHVLLQKNISKLCLYNLIRDPVKGCYRQDLLTTCYSE